MSSEVNPDLKKIQEEFNQVFHPYDRTLEAIGKLRQQAETNQKSESQDSHPPEEQK